MIVLNEIKVRKKIAELRAIQYLAGLTDKEAILLCKLEMLINNMLVKGELYQCDNCLLYQLFKQLMSQFIIQTEYDNEWII